jgi:hypothetical protein
MYDCTIISAAAFEDEYGFVGLSIDSSVNGGPDVQVPYTSSVLK